MALDAEEYKNRRKQMQQRQLAQRRRLRLRLIAAAVVLLLIGVLIFFVTRRGQSPEPTTPTADTTLTSPSVEGTEAEPTEPYTVIHFAAGGDLNVTDAVVASGGSGYDYTQALMDVAHLFADADIAAVNFEGNFFGAPYGSDSRSAPQTLATALSRAGVDLVQLANSYSIVHGMLGLSDTINCVRAAGMEPLGVYATNTEFSQRKGYTIREVQGIKIAFVAFTKGMVDGMALPTGSENCVNLLYKDYASTYQSVDTAGITAVLDAAEAESPDITVAMLHWGSEFNDTVSASQERICSIMQQHGVDVIIGTHAHYVQKMVFDPVKGTFTAYCLGDFFGDAARAGSEYSVILDLEITKDNNTGVTMVTDYTYTPIFTVAEANSPLRILRIREAIAAYEANYIDRVSQETYDAMEYALQRIEARVTGE